MLQSYPASTQLPASDFDRAKRFYQETLGFAIAEEFPGGARFNAGNGTFFWVYPSEFAGTNQATAMGFDVDDVEKLVDELSAKGITFEQFDLPYGKTDARGIAEMEGWKGAFFKDSEGNILALGQTGSA
jgi:catechol 2,3-dioxygenase-like lactoylglutathione lyase family enzyme